MRAANDRAAEPVLVPGEAWPIASLLPPAPWLGPSWWLVVFVVVCQSFLALGGTAAAAAAFAAMLFFVAANPRRCLHDAFADPLPWLYPALALASVLWSDAASISLRLATELSVVTFCMAAAGRRVLTRDLVSAVLAALLVTGAASFAVGARASLISTNVPLTGIYASKNLLAFHMVLLVLCGVAALADRAQPVLVRIAGAGALPLGLLMVRGAQSARAAVMGAGAVMVLLGVAFAGRLPRRLHARLFACAAIAGIGVTALVVTSGHELAEMLFTATGKDPGLTGRTYLWQRAAQLINERSLLGYGYQAFWLQDHPEAEALWFHFKILDRVGFHFHNLYYEVAIELGFSGLAVLAVTLVTYAWRTLRLALRFPCPQTGLLLAVCVLLLARSGIEVDLTYPLGTLAARCPILLTRRALPARRPLRAARPASPGRPYTAALAGPA